ncbi:MAG TPA: roadblock/LC7 domain-containing protein [Blastocatellia bacterium]|nr:roadblock/LC7 domain-containing protein [Blastocatellia bacterium]
MPFTNLLEHLVSSIDGATGALILEADGEAVQWFSRTDSELLRLRSAYLVNLLGSFRAATSRMILGELGYVVISYDGASFVMQELSGGYYLLLEINALSNLANAIYRLTQALPDARRAFEA